MHSCSPLKCEFADTGNDKYETVLFSYWNYKNSSLKVTINKPIIN